ncbi:MAG: hypothetical protein ABIT71_01890 [Vicinamibacteraceae bacterium]
MAWVMCAEAEADPAALIEVTRPDAASALIVRDAVALVEPDPIAPLGSFRSPERLAVAVIVPLTPDSSWDR